MCANCGESVGTSANQGVKEIGAWLVKTSGSSHIRIDQERTIKAAMSSRCSVSEGQNSRGAVEHPCVTSS